MINCNDIDVMVVRPASTGGYTIEVFERSLLEGVAFGPWQMAGQARVETHVALTPEGVSRIIKQVLRAGTPNSLIPTTVSRLLDIEIELTKD